MQKGLLHPPTLPAQGKVLEGMDADQRLRCKTQPWPVAVGLVCPPPTLHTEEVGGEQILLPMQ